MLGGEDAEGTGVRLEGDDRGIDGALDAVYGERGVGPERVGAAGRALAGRVALALPVRGGAGRAAGRDRPARAAQPAARARGARERDARRAPGGDADEPARRAARGQPRGGAARRAAGGGGHRAAAVGAHAGGGEGRPGPLLAHVAPEAERDRLGPHDPRQPAPLPARAPDGDPGAARRPRAPQALARGRADPVPGPEREHGRLGRPRRRARRLAGQPPDAADARGRLRHGGRGPHRGARRSGRRPVRHPARRRDRHRPGARLLPDARLQPRQDRPDPAHRPLRGRRRELDAAARGQPAAQRRAADRAARALRRRRARLRPRARGRGRRARRARLRLHARPVPGHARRRARGPRRVRLGRGRGISRGHRTLAVRA